MRGAAYTALPTQDPIGPSPQAAFLSPRRSPRGQQMMGSQAESGTNKGDKPNPNRRISSKNMTPSKFADLIVSEGLALQEEETKGFWKSLNESTSFQACMAGLICTNAIVMGLETDLPDALPWDVIENIFLMVFFSELLMKAGTQGTHFLACGNADIVWNSFDLLIISLGLIDLFMTIFIHTSSGSTATLFRIIRLLRIMRLFRLVKFLKQLYLLAFGFVEAVQAIFWVTVLMSIVLYVCSIVMVRTVGRLDKEEPHAQFLHAQFQDIRTSMMTLFVLMSSPNLPLYMSQDGLLWGRPGLLMFLICFVIIGSFGMIALLTGVISESMFEKNQLRVEEARKEQDEVIAHIENTANEIHASCSLDAKGEASHQEILSSAMPKMAIMFDEAMIEYTTHNLRQLVEIMDCNSTGRIGCEEFVGAVVTYANGLKPLSIQEVHHNVTVCIHLLREMHTAVFEKKGLMETQVMTLVDTAICPSVHGSAGPVREQSEDRRSFSADFADTVKSAKSDGDEPQASPLFAQALSGETGFLTDESMTHTRHSPRTFADSDVVLRGLQTLHEKADRQLASQLGLEEAMHRSLGELRRQLQTDLEETVKSCGAGGSRTSLPEGYEPGHQVLSNIDYTFKTGHVSKDDIGVVRGPSTSDDRRRLNVDFPNLRSANMLPSQIQRAPVGSPATPSTGGVALSPSAVAGANLPTAPATCSPLSSSVGGAALPLQPQMALAGFQATPVGGAGGKALAMQGSLVSPSLGGAVLPVQAQMFPSGSPASPGAGARW
mmetsp:Transcript_42975/g.135394  ORF Transcript_42975/g.135394 Transcript_42975/m.135394 type:complete len:774 (-) Transcript_42975:277-2598(-)